MSDLSQVIKAYDIRGTVPGQFDTRLAHEVGAAFAELTGAAQMILARDMRASSPDLAHAFAQGATARGCDILDVGLAATDMLYYASGVLHLPGAVITASHNPGDYNGIKLCKPGAAPVGQDTGLAEIRRMLEHGIPEPPSTTGVITQRDIRGDYANFLRSLVDLTGIRPLKVVIDAGNGMAGHTVPAVLGDTLLDTLPIDIVPMYFDLDGTFPNHEANPLEPANLVDLQEAVTGHRADLGLAFDGDADRCFIIDQQGMVVPPSAIIGLIAERELVKHPGRTIVYNVITSHAVPELVTDLGGVAVRERVGHSFIKETMAQHNAIFGGEHSGHYYFGDFWRADTGMLAAMHVLAALGTQDQPLSALSLKYQRYHASGEINRRVHDIPATLRRVASNIPSTTIDWLDGLTIQLPDGAWFNLRGSNTEPMLRLNVEAPTNIDVSRISQQVLDLIDTEP